MKKYFHFFAAICVLCASFLAASEPKKRVEIVSYCGRLPPGISDPDKYLSIKEKFKVNYTRNLYGFIKKFPGDDANLHKVVFIDYCRDPGMARLPKNKAICFRWEPGVLSPSLFSYYYKVFTFDDNLVDNKHYFKFYYPVLKPMTEKVPAFNEKLLCCMIATRWVPHRVQILDFFASKPKDSFHVYGSVRKAPKYLKHPMFKGSIPGWPSSDQKTETLSKYKFCVCFENTTTVPGYITEKVFDVFSGGCVPIYWGAGNVEKYIPKECFIDYRKFSNNEELYKYLTTMKESEYNGYIQNIRNFLKSDKAKLFSVENFEKTLCDAVLN